MENKSEKKKLFTFISGGKHPKKSSCCGNFEIEEIPEEEVSKEAAKSSCCGNSEVEEIPEEGVNKKSTKNSCCGG